MVSSIDLVKERVVGVECPRIDQVVAHLANNSNDNDNNGNDNNGNDNNDNDNNDNDENDDNDEMTKKQSRP